MISNLKLKIENLVKVFDFLSIFILCSYFFILCSSFVLADNMNSDLYRLQMGNFNMTGGNKSSSNYKLLDTVGQTAPGLYTSTGYIIKAGFPYIKTLIPFSFSIGTLAIDFGSLNAQSPVTVNGGTLTVSSGGAGGYQVTAFANHPLKLIAGSTTIPNAQCDAVPWCDINTARVWNLNTTYGFGYNMSSTDTPPTDIPADFAGSTYFRPFSDQSNGETPAVVMSSTHPGKSRHGTITYKANISAVQAAGQYDCIINFVATPNF